MEWLRLNKDGEIEFVMEEVKLVPEMQAILSLSYNKGKGDAVGRSRYRALNELKYMYLVYSFKSPYREYSEAERLEEAKKDCNLPPTWVESPELQKLVVKFLKGSENRTSRSIKIIEKFLDKFESHLEDINLNERTAQGALVHSPKAVMQTLQELPDFLKTLQELERQNKLGIVSTPTSKGDHELGWMSGNNSGSMLTTSELQE